MSELLNQYGQPVGHPMPDWSARARPQRISLEGQYCRIEPLNAEAHGPALFTAYHLAGDGRDWTYLGVERFDQQADYLHYLSQCEQSPDPFFYTIIDKHSGQAVGTISLMRIDPANGVIEVGNVSFSPALKQSPLSTEAQFLMMHYAFETLGYRRYEWKCDSRNAPSRKAADRLGFSFEGIFRQAIVYKGRSRDTAWYSIIDSEWPEVKAGFLAWLAADNFDEAGKQRQSLKALRESRQV
ncbi:GNAT family N-acetyltransferase [Pokkaliibacter sp. CJK22405]|uniref:GNAT family N-acetyltransferase n=1 Tax=Pokkaliibacter sp. CJK22405 TaxID=3384615 RepID=UPI003984CD27